ncbi:MAG: sulfatase-like hydrolase/transferase, partial [Bacteroidales bacterium]|nr:sulfatase-like hydrolase/transferase [Bacteroidales bacterium]
MKTHRYFKPVLFFSLFAFILLQGFQSCNRGTRVEETVTKPNIVIIYVDDLGYADLESFGAVGVRTPNINELDRMGLRFQDAHSSAATCSPSRFAMLTGSYAFRNEVRILQGDAPLLIRPGTPTMASMLKDAGYKD